MEFVFTAIGYSLAALFILLLVVDILALAVPILPIRKVPVSYNIRSLTVRWRITLLTSLAFTLVVGLLTVMLAFVEGMDRLTHGSGRPGNVIVLSDGATDELLSNLSYNDSSDVAREPGILRDDKGQPLVSREVYVVVNQPVPSGRRRFVQVRGIEDPEIAGRVHGLELFPGGSWFSEAGVQELPAGAGREPAIQAVLGEGVAHRLGQDYGKERFEVGDLFELGARQWIVVGITKSSGSSFSSEVWAKHQKVGDLFGKQNVFTTIVARTTDADTATEVSRNLTEYKKATLQALPETEYYAKLSEANKQFATVIYFVTVIMAIGGIFGVMNTMFAAVSQRSKDIGVLRILGYARWQILASFLLETLLVALLGGLLGGALGYLTDGWTATSIVSGGQGSGKGVVLKLVVDAKILAIGLFFTLVMGALGGLAPALAAMRLRPLESLR